jgi:hypothetical protein
MEMSPFSGRESRDKIWFLLRPRGDSQIEEFLIRLDSRTRGATLQLFDRTETSGPPRNPERFRHLTDVVYEFKVHRLLAARYVTCRIRDGWLITWAGPKPKSPELRRIIAHAMKIAAESERNRS